MIKVSRLLLCATFVLAGAASAQTTNEQTNDITTPVGGGTMTVDGSGTSTPGDPTVTLGDGTTTTGDASGAGDMGSADGAVAGGDAGDTPLPDGSFSKLSPGNQKIVRALFDAQPAVDGISHDLTDGMATGTGAGGTTPAAETSGTGNWTLDQIAAAKQHSGWGRVFKDMQDAGVIPLEVKNLGQLVSGKYQPSDLPTEPATVTTVDVESAASGDATGQADGGGAQAVDGPVQTKVTKTKVTTGAAAKTSGRGVQANRGGGSHSDLVITTGSGRQVHIGAASKSKAKTVGAVGAKGGKRRSLTGHGRGSTSTTTVVTTGSGAQAAIGAGRGLGHSKGVTSGVGRSSSGAGHSKRGGVHSGKGSSKFTVTTGRGGGKGFAHHGGGKGKGKGKVK